MQDRGRPPRTRGRSYAEIIQQLSGQVDSLHEALSQLQLENRDLKLRQEVLEQWCRINRLAVQVMHTCGGVLMRGQQQDLPQAAIAAIVGVEEWIQQQLVEFGPVPPDEATELPPPRGGSGSSASCTLHGGALSIQEYALRYLLAHPQHYTYIIGLIDPDVALAEVASCRERARTLLAAVEGQPSPRSGEAGAAKSMDDTAGATGGSPGRPAVLGADPCSGAALQLGGGTPQAGRVCSAAGSDGIPQMPHNGVHAGTNTEPPGAPAGVAAEAAREAAVQELANWTLHCWTGVVCAQLLDPAINYGCVHKAAQLAGPPTQAKLQSVVDALQLSPEQRAQIAACVRVVSQLLAPAQAAWDQALRQMREVLLSMQQQQQAQHQAQPQRQQVQADRLTAAAACTTAAAAGAAGREAALAAGLDTGTVSPTSSSYGQLPEPSSVAAGSRAEQMAGHQNGSAHITTPALVEGAAVDHHSRLSYLVQRLNTLNRTLGWLEMTQAYAGLGVLSWQQMGQLLVVTEPYPWIPRLVLQLVASQWEEQHEMYCAPRSSNGQGDEAGWPQRLGPPNGQQHSSVVDGPKKQQQRNAADACGTSSRVACSTRLPQRPGQQCVSSEMDVQLNGSCNNPADSRHLPAPMDNSRGWPPHHQVWGPVHPERPIDTFGPAAPAPAQVQQVYSLHRHYHHHSQCHYQYQHQQEQRHQQHQHQPMPSGLADTTAVHGCLSASAVHQTGMTGVHADDAVAVALHALPAQAMAGASGVLQRSVLLPGLLQLCDMVLEQGLQGVPGQEEGAGAALDALLDMLLE